MYAKQWLSLIYSISYGILRKSPLTNKLTQNNFYQKNYSLSIWTGKLYI